VRRDRDDQPVARWERTRREELSTRLVRPQPVASGVGGALASIAVVALAAAGMLGLWLLFTSDDDESRSGGKATAVTGTDFERRQIYHSPQSPGYTAWTGLWTMPDGRLMTGFAQVTGPIPSPPDRAWDTHETSSILLSSRDGGETWERFFSEKVSGPPHAYSAQATIGLKDGSILRRVNGEDLQEFSAGGPATAYIQRLEPGADEFGPPVTLLDPAQYTYQVTRIQYLSDGRLIATGNFWEVPAGERQEEVPLDQQGWLLAVSDDEGRTWDNALTVPEENSVPPNEWDVAELPDGDLLAVMRTHDPADPATQFRSQAILEKDGEGWVMGKPEDAPFPHSGHPELLATEEGVVLYVSSEGIEYTSDAGERWRPLKFKLRGGAKYRSLYYPVSVQAPSGDIYVVSHAGGDDNYGERDQSVVMDRFRLSASE
jgi:hypothetical protein